MGNKYKKNECFVYTTRLNNPQFNRTFFVIDDIMWSMNKNNWLYTVFYPETSEYRRYTEDKVDDNCQKFNMKQNEIVKLLYVK